MQRISIAVVVVGIALVVIWYVRRSPDAAVDPPMTRRTTGGVSSETASDRPPAHATRISPDARRQLGERIAAAQAARKSALGSTAPPATAPPATAPRDSRALSGDQVETMKTPILDALRETMPFVRECLDKEPGSATKSDFSIQGNLMLTGDPDIGTLVDADKLTDEFDQPLPAALDDCLRGALQGIELPPLREGDKMHVKYVYKFTDDDKR